MLIHLLDSRIVEKCMNQHHHAQRHLAKTSKNNVFPPGVSTVSSTSCRHVSERITKSNSGLSIWTMKSINRPVLRLLCKFYCTKCMQIKFEQWFASCVDKGTVCNHFCFVKSIPTLNLGSIISRIPSTTALASNHSKPRFLPTKATGTCLHWSRTSALHVL